MKIVLAQSAGFCYGVRRAVELAEEKAAQSVPCVMLGPLIHNKDVTGRLAAQGLRVVNSPEEAPEGFGVIIRSHGESRAVHLSQRHPHPPDRGGGGKTGPEAGDRGHSGPSRGAGHRWMV